MIYFIQAAESKRIKIGFSASDPAHRRASMQVGCPEELILLFCIDGDQNKEKALHTKYSSHKVRGEWFKCESDLKEFVDSNTPDTVPTEPALRGEDFLNNNPRYEALYHALSSLSDANDLTMQLYNEDTDTYIKAFPHAHWTATKWRAEIEKVAEAVKQAYSAVQKFENCAQRNDGMDELSREEIADIYPPQKALLLREASV